MNRPYRVLAFIIFSALGALGAIGAFGVPALAEYSPGGGGGSAGPVACGNLPALTGDTTTSAGSCATTVGKINGATPAAVATSGLASDLTPALDAALSGIVTTFTTQAAINAANLCTLRGGTIALGGNVPLTITLPTTGSCGGRAQWRILNTDTYTGPCSGRGKFISIPGAPTGESRQLWPRQDVVVNDTGAKLIAHFPMRWRTPQQSNLSGCSMSATAISWDGATGVTATIFGGAMYVTAVGSGTLTRGQGVYGTGFTTAPIIETQISGATGGVGAYAINNELNTLSTPTTVTTGRALATVASTQYLQSYDPVVVSASNVGGYNAPSPGVTILDISTTQFAYPLQTDPGSSATSATVHDTNGYIEFFAGPTNAADDGTNDCLGWDTPCASVAFALTNYAVAGTSTDDVGGASFTRVTGAAGWTDHKHLHDSVWGPLNSGGHSYILNGNGPLESFVMDGSDNNTTHSTIECNGGCELFLTNVTGDAVGNLPFIKEIQGGHIYWEDGNVCRKAAICVQTFEASKSWFEFAANVFVDPSLGTPTSFFSGQGGYLEASATSITVQYLASAAYSGDYLFATNGEQMVMPNMTLNIGGTRFVPTALSWAANVLTATFASTTGMATGDQMEFLGNTPIGYNVLCTITVLGGGTQVTCPLTLSANPGVGTNFGTAIDIGPSGSPTGFSVTAQRAYEGHMNAAFNLNNSTLPGSLVLLDSGAAVSGDVFTADARTYSATQTFNASGNALITSTGVARFQAGFNASLGTVATLPTCTSSIYNQQESVNDALVPVLGQTVVGGGVRRVPVVCSSTNTWVVGADAILPSPGVSSLGGVNSKAAVSNQFLNQIGTDGSVSAAQPDFTNLTGAATVAQLPNSTGVALDVSSATNSWKLPSGTSAQRPTGAAGMERYNTDMGAREAFSATSSTWRPYGGVYTIQAGGPLSTSSATEANLVAIKIPGGMLNASGTVLVRTVWSYTNSANAKSPRVRYSATSGSVNSGDMAITSQSLTTTTMFSDERMIHAQGTAAQFVFPGGSAVPYTTSTASVAGQKSTINTANDWYVNINGFVAGGETLTLEYYLAEVINPRRRRTTVPWRRRACNDNRRSPNRRRLSA